MIVCFSRPAPRRKRQCLLFATIFSRFVPFLLLPLFCGIAHMGKRQKKPSASPLEGRDSRRFRAVTGEDFRHRREKYRQREKNLGGPHTRHQSEKRPERILFCQFSGSAGEEGDNKIASRVDGLCVGQNFRREMR